MQVIGCGTARGRSAPRAGTSRAALGALVSSLLFPGVALAAQPQPWEMALQPAATPVAENIHALHDALLIVITLISLFVLALLVAVMFRFNARSNPTPLAHHAQHHDRGGVTVVPVLILIGIAIPSFKLLYFQRVSRRPISPSRRSATSGTGPTSIPTSAR